MIFRFHLLYVNKNNPKWQVLFIYIIVKYTTNVCTNMYQQCANSDLYRLYYRAPCHYVLRFCGIATTTMNISFQGLKFEFDLPIPNDFGCSFMKSWSSSILSILYIERKCQKCFSFFLPDRKEFLRKTNARRSFSCP